jgi:hypothetical protein
MNLNKLVVNMKLILIKERSLSVMIRKLLTLNIQKIKNQEEVKKDILIEQRSQEVLEVIVDKEEGEVVIDIGEIEVEVRISLVINKKII